MDSTSQRCPLQQHFNNNILPVYLFTKHYSLQECIRCVVVTISWFIVLISIFLIITNDFS